MKMKQLHNDEDSLFDLKRTLEVQKELKQHTSVAQQKHDNIKRKTDAEKANVSFVVDFHIYKVIMTTKCFCLTQHCWLFD